MRAMKFLEHAFKEIVTFVILAVLIVLPIRLFLAQPFVVEGESMHPTFENGDYLIVDELTYRFETPRRGDVIVFRYPGNPSIFYIKRIVGLPNESVSINRGKVTITRTDGTKLTLDESYAVSEDATYSENTHLGANEYFVLGDNRPNSSDSRVWGALPANDIIGKPVLRLLPPTEASVFPGNATEPQ
jgi:signal peptidase I